MKLFLKISAGIFSLIIIAVFAIVFTFNPNDYKPDIITLVKDQTGRELSIPGDISLSLFPWIGLELGKIELSNAKGFAQKPFAKISNLQVRVKLLPLFKQKFEADTFKIKGLTLNLEKNLQGITNWDDLLQKDSVPKQEIKTETETETETETKTATKKDSQAKLLAAFALNGIEIEQSQVHWNDQQQKQKIAIDNLQLNIGQLKLNSPIPIHTQFNVTTNDLATKLKLKTVLTLSSDFKKIKLQSTQFDSDIKLPALKKTQSINIASQLIALNLNEQIAKSDNISIASNGAKINIQFLAKDIQTSPLVNAHLNIEALNPKAIAKEFDVVLPSMSDKNALTKFQADIDVFTDLKKATLSNIKFILDDTQITGKASIPFAAAPIVSLNIDRINIDRYLATPVPPTPSNKEVKKGTNNKSSIEAALIPVALLTQMDIDAALKIGALQIKNTHWKNLHIAAKAYKGNVQIKPLRLQGYGSTINSQLKIQAKKKTAFLSASLDIHNIKAGEILDDFMKVKNLQGVTSLNANISTKGITLSQLKKNLNGKVRFNLKEAIVKGINVEYEINKLKAKINRKAEPTKPSPVQTKLTKVSASAIIKNGVVHNKDLRAATPFTRIIGSGRVDLVKEKLDYVVTAKFTNSNKIHSTTPFHKINSLPLDINIGGTFSQPTIKVNFEKVLNSLLNAELRKQQQKIEQQLKEQERKIKEQLKQQEEKIKAELKQREKEIKEKAKRDLELKKQKMEDDLKKKLDDKLKNLLKF